jgi:ribonuclease HII
VITKTNKLILGVDEVGRGPLAGPVTVCLFISEEEFDSKSIFPYPTIRDSKRANKALKQYIYQTIRNLRKYKYRKIDWVIVSKSAKYIDKHGINKSISKCIDIGIKRLTAKGYAIEHTKAYFDGGLTAKDSFLSKETIIKGDEKIGHIAIASILAKIARDSYMNRLSKKYPNYGWDTNVGYGSSKHTKAIKIHGATDFHRVSFLKKLI